MARPTSCCTKRPRDAFWRNSPRSCGSSSVGWFFAAKGASLHLLPLFVALGAGGEEPKPSRLHASATHGVLRMDAYPFGERPDERVSARPRVCPAWGRIVRRCDGVDRWNAAAENVLKHLIAGRPASRALRLGHRLRSRFDEIAFGDMGNQPGPCFRSQSTASLLF